MVTPDTAVTATPRAVRNSTSADLEATWERARRSPRYAHLGVYSERAFADLGVTSKDDLKSDPWGYVAIDDSAVTKYYETTGTSGFVTPTPRTRDDLRHNTAAVARGWGTLISGDDRVLSLLPSDVVPVGDLITSVMDSLGAMYAKSYPYAQGVSGWDRILPLWERLRPTVVFAAPGVLRELTKLAAGRQILDQLAASVHTIMLLGEVSVRALRNRLGGLWSATVIDASYGSTETGTLATGCSAGNLHALVDDHVFELRDSLSAIVGVDRDLASVAHGALVVTPLHAYARPLLRFEMGDLITVGEPCACTDDRPRITVGGRASDVIISSTAQLDLSTIENAVYTDTEAIGYLLEVDSIRNATQARVLLERLAPDAASEERDAEVLERAVRRASGFDDLTVLWLNNLPQSTRSGGSQKNWKSSNVREAAW